MLRTIMIFPEFDNIEIIDRIRAKYDPLAGLVRPHITLVFPFDSELTNGQLEEALNDCIVEKPFEIVLHDKLYKEYFKAYDLGLPYRPHMTVGKLADEQALDKAFEDVSGIDDRFTVVIDKVSVEVIGEKGESIIVVEKRLR